MTSISELRRSARRGGADAAEQIEELRDSIETLSDEVNRFVRRSARTARGSAWNRLDTAQDAIEDGYIYARDTARRGTRMVRRHPVPAAALAVGIGLVLAGLLVSMTGDGDR